LGEEIAYLESWSKGFQRTPVLRRREERAREKGMERGAREREREREREKGCVETSMERLGG